VATAGIEIQFTVRIPEGRAKGEEPRYRGKKLIDARCNMSLNFKMGEETQMSKLRTLEKV